MSLVKVSRRASSPWATNSAPTASPASKPTSVHFFLRRLRRIFKLCGHGSELFKRSGKVLNNLAGDYLRRRQMVEVLKRLVA